MDDIRVNENLTIPGYEVWFTTSRSSGAGGQHVNRTESRVTLHWSPGNSSALTPSQKNRVLARLSNRITSDGVLQLDVETHRSQHRNKAEACERLAELLVSALRRRKRRIKTRPTRGSKERRLQAKKQLGEKKRLRKPPKFNDG